MQSPIYIGLSRQIALQRQMDVIANNVANMDTDGYKAEGLQFEEFIDHPAPGESLSMVQDRGTVRNMTEGAITTTGNPLDMAIEGDGFFAVQTTNGIRYTRSGRFQLDSGRRLVTSSGLPVLDSAGRAITVPAGATDITVSGTGQISTEQGPLATLNVVRFANEQALESLGDGLYRSTAPSLPATGAKILQNALEKSNVQPIAEMTRMISVLRLYQTNPQLLKAEHQRQLDMISKLSQTQ